MHNKELHKNNKMTIDSIAEQWVNLVFAHIAYKNNSLKNNEDKDKRNNE